MYKLCFIYYQFLILFPFLSRKGIILYDFSFKMSANDYQSNQKLFCNHLNVLFHILQFQK